MVNENILTIADLAYAAGIVDGEGCVSIKCSRGARPNRASPEYRVYILVANTDKRLIEWFYIKFGGSTGQRSTGFCKNERPRKICYRWRISARSAVNFLKLIRPYMVIKGTQADVCTTFQTSIGGWGRNPIPADNLLFREKCFQETRILNKKGA